MNRAALFCLSFVLCCTSMQAKRPPKPANFSGTWALDFTQSKDLPPGLKNYHIVVAQNSEQLKLKATIEGNLNARRSSSEAGEGGGYPGGMGMPGRGYPGGYPGMGRPMGIPGIGFPGRRGGIGSESGTRAEAAAFTLYPSSAAFFLDGGKSSGMLGGSAESDATLTANWAKKGKELNLVMAGTEESRMGSGSVEIKDQWKFSKDGQSLMIDRSVQSPSGSKKLHLIFYKQRAG